MTNSGVATELLITDELKQCSSCRTELPWSEFHKGDDKFGLHYWCKSCKRDSNRKNYEKSARRDKRLMATYGLLSGDYFLWLEAQDHCCAICGLHEDDNVQNVESGAIMLAVDHDHGTDEIRGLLCWRCNLGLGYFQDSPDRLEDAARYIENFRQSSLASAQHLLV